jgi:acetylglutamate kinase
MQEVVRKAGVLIEALPYIQEFRGSTIVIKLGGSMMEDSECMDGTLLDIAFMECVDMLPIIVHGGGKAISRGMAKEGIVSKFVKGLRVTCEKSIEVVARVIKEEVNPSIVKRLQEKGASAESVNGEDVFHVSRKTESDEKTGEIIDWGFVGVPGEVDPEPLMSLLSKGIIPVVTPLGIGPDGQVHNINADTAAAAVAKAVKARKLVYLSDVPGLLRDPDDPDSLIMTLKESEVESLIEAGVISGGMLPKVQGSVDALLAGVRKIHMIDGRMKHSLLLEIFTKQGVGTEIVA